MKDHQQLAIEAARLISEGLSAGYPRLDKQRRESMEQWLPAYSTATLKKIIASTHASERYWGVEEAMHNGDLSDEEIVSDYLNIAEVFERHGHMELETMLPFLLSLNLYDDLTPRGPNFEYPESRVKQCSAIVEVTTRMTHLIETGESESDDLLDYVPSRPIDGMIPFIADPNLRALLTSDDYDPERVAALVVERDIVDANELIGLLRLSPAAAIAEGVL